MELRLTSSWRLDVMSEGIWLNIFLDVNDGSAVQVRKPLCFSRGHLIVQSYRPATISYVGYVKDRVFVPPLPVDIDDLKQ